MKREDSSSASGHSGSVNVTSTERRVALTGSAASEWLEERGWTFSGGMSPQQLYADEIRRDDFVVRRQWTSTMHGSRTSPHSEITEVTLIIEGDATVRIPGKESRLHGGYAIWRNRGANITLESRAPIALMQIETASIPRGFVSLDGAREAVFQTSPALREMLASQISATLNSEMEPSMNEFSYMKVSIDYATMALLLGISKRPTRDRRLYQRAVDIMMTRASDPRLTLDMIADELNVSKSHLQRAFRRMGTTPLSFLEQKRVVFARELFGEGRASTRDEAELTARQAGFSSARVMKDAFRRESTRKTRLADRLEADTAGRRPRVEPAGHEQHVPQGGLRRADPAR